jgi:hypothetical protein
MSMKGSQDTTGQDVIVKSVARVDTLFAHGRRHALLSGTTKSLSEDVKSLSAYARGVARDTYTEEFNPAAIEQDRLQADEHERTLAAIDESGITIAHARGALVASERTLAEGPKPGGEPAASWFIVLSAVAVLTLSFSPTLRDRVFHDFDDIWSAWFVSFACGTFLAAFIAWMMLQTISTVGRLGTWINALGLGAGLTFGLAAGLLRWSITESSEGQIMAIGMTLMEMCAIAYLEWLALSLRAAHAEWAAATATRGQLEAIRDADANHLQQRLLVDAELRARAEAHVNYVETRWVRHHKIQEIETAAVDAVLNGYNEGVNENCGFTRGLRRVS